MNMKLRSTLLAVLAVSTVMLTPTAFASLSLNDAEQAVSKEYPGATITRVKQDREQGRQVYEVKFYTQSIWEGELTIDAENGAILERKEKYDVYYQK